MKHRSNSAEVHLLHRPPGRTQGLPDIARQRSSGALSGDAVGTPGAHTGLSAGAVASAAVLRALASFVDPIAAFCIIWPADFAYLAVAPSGECVTNEEVLAVPREQFAAAFLADPQVGLSGSSAGAATPLTLWRVERLPPSLQRPPFVVSGVTKITLPICRAGALAGFAGLVLSCKLGDVEHAWYAGCCAALDESLAKCTPADAAPAPSGTSLANHGIDTEPGERQGDLPLRPQSVPNLVDSTKASPEVCDAAKALSTRELEIAKYLAQGHSTINVGAILGLSPNTIRTHVRRIYIKLNVCSRVELAQLVRA